MHQHFIVFHKESCDSQLFHHLKTFDNTSLIRRTLAEIGARDNVTQDRNFLVGLREKFGF